MLDTAFINFTRGPWSIKIAMTQQIDEELCHHRSSMSCIACACVTYHRKSYVSPFLFIHAMKLLQTQLAVLHNN